MSEFNRNNLVKALKYLYDSEVYGYVHEGYGHSPYVSVDAINNFNVLLVQAQQLEPTIPGITFEKPKQDRWVRVCHVELLNAIKAVLEYLAPDYITELRDFELERKHYKENWGNRANTREVNKYNTDISYDIFLSYTAGDAHVARELRDEFESAGFKCFMAEKDVKVGEDWNNDIRKSIMHSKSVVLLITPRSINKHWPLMETGAAWALGKKIIPAIINVDIDKLPDPVKRYQARFIETMQQRKELIKQLSDDSSI